MSAKLAEYNPINRNGSLYAHTGAKSRKISLSFSLSLPHIHQSLKGVADFLQSNRKKLSIEGMKTQI
jgi:hypothetical protein